MKILKVKSILFSLLAIALLTVTLTSCQKESFISEIELDERKLLDSFNENVTTMKMENTIPTLIPKFKFGQTHMIISNVC